MELRPYFEWRGLGFISHSALQGPGEVRGLRRRAAVRGARRAGRRPQGVPVRRGAQGRAQAVGVQGVRHRVHAGDPDRHLHGLARGRLRRVLQLRPDEPGPGRARPHGRAGHDGPGHAAGRSAELDRRGAARARRARRAAEAPRREPASRRQLPGRPRAAGARPDRPGPAPPAQGQGRADHDVARRGRQGDADPDRGRSSWTRSATRCSSRSRTRPGCTVGAVPGGADHRLLRGLAAVLPRRRHRRPGRQRHGQRPGRVRGHAAVPVGRASSSRRASRSPT